MASPCDSIILLELQKHLQLVFEEITSFLRLFKPSELKNIAGQIKENSTDFTKELVKEVGDLVAEFETGAIRALIENAMKMDIKTAKTEFEKRIGLLSTYVYNLAVVLVATPDLDLVIMGDSLEDARKYLYKYVEGLEKLRSDLNAIYQVIPEADIAMDFGDKVRQLIDRWIDELSRAEALLEDTSLKVKQGLPVYPNISIADNKVNSVIVSMLSIMPDAELDPIEFLKHNKYLDLKYRFKDIAQTVPDMVKNYGQLIFFLDGIVAFGDLTKDIKKRFSLGPAFDKFAATISVVLADILIGIIDNMESSKEYGVSPFIIAGAYYEWLAGLETVHAVLLGLIKPVTEAVYKFHSNRDNITKILEDLRKDMLETKFHNLSEQVVSIANKILLMGPFSRIKKEVEKLIDLITKELSVANKINNDLHELEFNLPPAGEFEKSALQMAKKITTALGVPPDKFNVKAIQNIYKDARYGVLGASLTVELVKCFIEKIKQAKTVNEAMQYRDTYTLLSENNSSNAVNLSSTHVQRYFFLKDKLEKIQQMISQVQNLT